MRLWKQWRTIRWSVWRKQRKLLLSRKSNANGLCSRSNG
nr:MAG TPA: hypothetical protein [Bacteriophage sp.]